MPMTDTEWDKTSIVSCRSSIALIWMVCLLLTNAHSGAKSRTVTVRSRVSPVATGIVQEMLNVHNSIRSRMKLPPLEWSSELAAFSQKWANTLLAKNRSAHNPNTPYGENILITGIGATPSMIVNDWASESRDYSYPENACSTDCGHYTQIVWRSTRRMGCAVARGSQREIWVCSYDPPGNYRGELPY